MIAAVAAFFAKSALMQSPIGALLKAVPRWAWIALAVVLVIAAGLVWHGHKVKAFGEARYYDGWNARGAEIAALQATLGRKDAEIAQAIREKNDAENRRIAADARDVLMRGPGRAACVAAIPSTASGPERAAPAAGASVDPVPSGEGLDLIGLPFAPAVSLAEEHDQLLNELTRWHEWYRRFTDEWAKAQAAAPATTTPVPSPGR